MVNKRNTVSLSEAQLNKVITESVIRVLKEYNMTENSENEAFLGMFKNKQEKALQLYTKYRDLLTKANQMQSVVKTKSSNAFGMNKKQSYGAASDFAKNGYGRQSQKPMPQAVPESKQRNNSSINEEVDEGFWGGLKGAANGVVNNIKNKPIAQAFQGTKQNYRMGDAASDVESYQQLVGQVNRAKQEFLNYCKQNSLKPVDIVTSFDRQSRYNVLQGKDNSQVGLRRATSNSKINGMTSNAGNTKDLQASNANWRDKQKTMKDNAVKTNTTTKDKF